MRRKAKTAYLLALAVLLAFFGAGCSINNSSVGGSHAAERPAADYLDEYQRTEVRHSLTLTAKKAFESGCTISYPFVCDEGMELINIAIQTAFLEFAADCEVAGSNVSYSVEFNRYGLLSVIAVCSDPSGREIITDTANFDTDTGRRVYLSDCFGADASVYSARLMELIERTADSAGYTFLGERPEIGDSTRFVFTFGGIELIFPEYEVFTYEAGSPRIKIGLGSLSGLISADGLLNRLK